MAAFAAAAAQSMLPAFGGAVVDMHHPSLLQILSCTSALQRNEVHGCCLNEPRSPAMQETLHVLH